jgi:hypothetical protein
MKINNIHQRTLSLSLDDAKKLIDHLASEQDILWPHQKWPAMKFDSGLKIGAQGGHGPIRYNIVEYNPGNFIRFQFTAPSGFNGYHAFKLKQLDASNVHLSHEIKMEIAGPALITWPFIFRPLHDALMEDAMTRAEQFAKMTTRPIRWSFWVRLLRSMFKRG